MARTRRVDLNLPAGVLAEPCFFGAMRRAVGKLLMDVETDGPSLE